VVDLRTRTVHLVTPEVAAAGRQADGRYIALCGDVLLDDGLDQRAPAEVTRSAQSTLRLLDGSRTWVLDVDCLPSHRHQLIAGVTRRSHE
jgi:hypothetical protein